MKLETYKIGDKWHYCYGSQHDGPFATKDEARMNGELYVSNKRKEEARARAEARKKKAEKSEQSD